MKVLLHVDVPKLGYLGDVVEVNDGYARNYLLPQRLAVEPNEANVKAIAEERARQAELRRLARQQLERLAEAVEGVEITIEALANEQGHLFGSVGESEIAKALQQRSLEVQAKHIRLGEHLRQLGGYDVQLHFATDLDAQIHVRVVSSEVQEGDEQSGADETEAAGESVDEAVEQ